ncbi:MAG: hypothetical protein AAFQ94_30805, partial [Bacteroidota bacterium]
MIGSIPAEVGFSSTIKDKTVSSFSILCFFRTITLYENKATEATYKELANGKYQVDLKLNCIKYLADSLGNEKQLVIA